MEKVGTRREDTNKTSSGKKTSTLEANKFAFVCVCVERTELKRM